VCRWPSIAAVVEREPVVTGKPACFLVNDIIARHACSPHKMIMVGDRLDTDILWGRNTGMATLLVMTGEGSRASMAPWRRRRRAPHPLLRCA
jgi:phosphoglycolate phosphatase